MSRSEVLRGKFRKRRFVSVSTSFSGSSGDLDKGLKKMNSHSNLYSHRNFKNKSHTVVDRPNNDEEEEYIITSTIKEVESEEDDQEAEALDEEDEPMKITTKDRAYSDLS